LSYFLVIFARPIIFENMADLAANRCQFFSWKC